jgi:hypothetical protein
VEVGPNLRPTIQLPKAKVFNEFFTVISVPGKHFLMPNTLRISPAVFADPVLLKILHFAKIHPVVNQTIHLGVILGVKLQMPLIKMVEIWKIFLISWKI